eukprot:4507265-Prymnesium_polylepis.2
MAHVRSKPPRHGIPRQLVLLVGAEREAEHGVGAAKDSERVVVQRVHVDVVVDPHDKLKPPKRIHPLKCKEAAHVAIPHATAAGQVRGHTERSVPPRINSPDAKPGKRPEIVGKVALVEREIVVLDRRHRCAQRLASHNVRCDAARIATQQCESSQCDRGHAGLQRRVGRVLRTSQLVQACAAQDKSLAEHAQSPCWHIVIQCTNMVRQEQRRRFEEVAVGAHACCGVHVHGATAEHDKYPVVIEQATSDVDYPFHGARRLQDGRGHVRCDEDGVRSLLLQLHALEGHQ